MSAKIIINVNVIPETPAEITALLYCMFDSVEPGNSEITSNDFTPDTVNAIAGLFIHKDAGGNEIAPSFLLTDGKYDPSWNKYLAPSAGGLSTQSSHIQQSSIEGAQYQYVGHCRTDVPDSRIDGLMQFIHPWLVPTDQPAFMYFPEYSEHLTQHSFAWVYMGDGIKKAKVEGSDVEHGFNQMTFAEVFDLFSEAIPTAEEVELDADTVKHNLDYGQFLAAEAEIFNRKLVIIREDLVRLCGGESKEFVERAVHTAINKLLVEYVSSCLLTSDTEMGFSPSRVYLFEMIAYEHIQSLMASDGYVPSPSFKTYGTRTILRRYLDAPNEFFHNTPDHFNASLTLRTGIAVAYMGN